MSTIQKIRDLGISENILKLDNAVYNKARDELIISFVYPENAPLEQNKRDEILQLINSDLANECAVTVKFNKSCFDYEVIYNRVMQFITDNYKVLKNEFKRDDILIEPSDIGASITFLCDEMRRQVLLNRGFDADLIKFLKHKFFIDFDVKFEVAKDSPDYQALLNEMPHVDTSLSDALAEESRINKMIIELGECFYGKYMAGETTFIADITMDTEKELFIAGVISNLNISKYMSRSRGEQAPTEKTKISFTLNDPSGTIDIVVFPSDKNIRSLDILEEGMSVAVGGNLSLFNDSRNVRAVSLSKCDIVTKEVKRVYRKVNDDYYFVKPEPVYEVQQMDLFSMGGKNTDYWDTHDSVVVFDLETTGLDAKTCKIIEIGAVKIVKGSIIETFQTLINPQVPIPAEITNITHIDDSMVADAPTIEQVLPDFYRFVDGSVLSAYNIDFDYQFLDNVGKKLRLLFNHEQIDTLKLARNKVPSLSNYKLATVVKALNITLTNAHRALADAYATAKVFVKLI